MLVLVLLLRLRVLAFSMIAASLGSAAGLITLRGSVLVLVLVLRLRVLAFPP